MTLRWGIVTAGKISHDFVNAFNTYPDVGDQTIVAIAARNKDKAAEFAKLHNIPKVFDSYKALAESNDIDVVYIGALNPDHYHLSILFLENGKHVLCEKPFCMNQKQGKSLASFAKKKKLFLMEALWSRFSPAYIALEKELESGVLGEIQHVEVNFGIDVESERILKKELGGSTLMDIGSYTLQLAQYVFKEEPRNVIAVGNLNEDGVDTSETIILEYSGGRRAVLNTNVHLKLWNKATIYGKKGRITVEEPFHFPVSYTDANGELKTFALHMSTLPYNFGNSAGLVFQALETARCIKAGLLESPRMPHKETLILSKLEDNIRKQLGVHYDVDDQDYPIYA